MIDLYLLEQLLAFAQHGTLSAASEHLYLSQPALSRSMRKLENLLGIQLFDRQKNKITLNETGKLAADYAARILQLEKDMINRIQSFDRSRHTITLGSCAPVPVSDLVPLLTQLYPNMTIVSEMKTDEKLLQGLQNDIYQIVVLHEKPSDDTILHFQAYKQEKLYLSLPPEHPLTQYSALHLSDLDGQNLLLYTQIGFWYDLCRDRMPNAHFLMMNEYDAFGKIAQTSAFPSFASDVILHQTGKPENRVILPFLDPEVHVTYYCTCKTSAYPVYRRLFQNLPKL